MRMEDVPVFFAGIKAKGRKAPDGSHWCRCCNTTISLNSRAAFCNQHQVERNSQIKRFSEAHTVNAALVPVEAIDEVLARKRKLDEALGAASAAFRAMDPPPHGSWVDRLMLASKDLTHSVERLQDFVRVAETRQPLEPPVVLDIRPGVPATGANATRRH